MCRCFCNGYIKSYFSNDVEMKPLGRIYYESYVCLGHMFDHAELSDNGGTMKEPLSGMPLEGLVLVESWYSHCTKSYFIPMISCDDMSIKRIVWSLFENLVTCMRFRSVA